MPIITISRGTFSGGKDLAECLAGKLQYPCISREVLMEGAEQYGVSSAELGTALSRAPSLLDRIGRDRDKYLACIRAVLYQHARAGNFVYHGHAGHHLLAGIRHLVRVRVVADLTQRIKAAMERLNMTSRQAETHIRKVDNERRKWTRFLYGVKWEDPANYDVVLNVEYLGVSGACAAILRITELEQFQPTAESAQAVENHALSSLVVAALAMDERTGGGDFRVIAQDGVVTIEGLVKLQQIADNVVDVASAVPGVRKVVNQTAMNSLPPWGG